MMYYNADGSYGGMCGNGGRCVARFAHLIGISKTEMNFEALDQIYTAKVMSDGDVKLHMPKPQTLKLNFKLSAETAQGKDIVNACYADTGSPHVVIFTHDLGNAREMVDIDSIDVLAMGRSIRYHREWCSKD
jgi:diaminopimelate epimerase